jgi:hypothetical protein
MFKKLIISNNILKNYNIILKDNKIYKIIIKKKLVIVPTFRNNLIDLLIVLKLNIILIIH